MQKSRLELLRLQTMMVLWKQTRNRTIIDVEFENPALSVTVQSYRLLTHTLRLRGESPFPRGSRIARFSDDVPRLQRQAATAYLETHLVTRFDLQISENQQKLITSIPSFRKLSELENSVLRESTYSNFSVLTNPPGRQVRRVSTSTCQSS